MGRGAEMARKGTFRAVVAVLLGLLAALCLLSLAAAQARNEVPTIVENECTNLKPKACKKSAICLSTYDGKKKKKKCGVCRYQYVAPEIPVIPVTPEKPTPTPTPTPPPTPAKPTPTPAFPPPIVDGDGAPKDTD